MAPVGRLVTTELAGTVTVCVVEAVAVEGPLLVVVTE